MNILVIEDERKTSDLIQLYLQRNGYTSLAAADGHTGLEMARTHQPDLIVLDLMLPGLDGLDLCRILRAEANIPIIMLTARSTEDDKLLGLDLGADDYLTKPFSPRELVARVEAILRRRRSGPPPSATLSFAHLTINPDSHEAHASGQLLELTATEFQVLWELARNAGRVLTRDQLVQQVWGTNFYGNDRVVDVYVGQVRRKLQDATQQTLIETVRGVGYKFVDTKS